MSELPTDLTPPTQTTLVVYNPRSGRLQADPAVRERLTRDDIRLLPLEGDLDLSRSILEAVRDEGCRHVIAAGGDGTVNSVVNAIMRVDAQHRPAMSILPLGTANDFAGTLGIPDDIDEALRLALDPQFVPTDVICIEANNFREYFANVATGGNSVKVTEAVTDEMKQSWGAFCYVRGVIGVLSELEAYHVQLELQTDGGPELIERTSWSILVANGRTNAGRLVVAPEASVQDGLMDVILIEDGSLLDVAAIGTELLVGNYLAHPLVQFRQARRVTIRSEPAMRFTMDGEIIDYEPISFEVIPAAIQMTHGA